MCRAAGVRSSAGSQVDHTIISSLECDIYPTDARISETFFFFSQNNNSLFFKSQHGKWFFAPLVIYRLFLLFLVLLFLLLVLILLLLLCRRCPRCYNPIMCLCTQKVSYSGTLCSSCQRSLFLSLLLWLKIGVIRPLLVVQQKAWIPHAVRRPFEWKWPPSGS